MRAICAFALSLRLLGRVVAAEARTELLDTVQLLQVASAGVSNEDGSAPAGSFVDGESAACFEGALRLAEGALALKKASPLGALYNQTFARPHLTCSERGYTVEGDEDSCFPGLRAYFRSAAGPARAAELERDALKVYRTTFSVSEGKAKLLVACTCHPESQQRVQSAGECARLDAVGSWVHRNPVTGKMLVCDQGPFEYAARALATLKSSPMLPMHMRDQIVPVPCAKLGFPLMFGAIDHCFPQLRMWTRTEEPMHNCPPGGLGPNNPDCDDWGVVESGEVEKALVLGKGFKAFAAKLGLSAVSDYYPACNCRADSLVVKHYEKQKGSGICMPAESHSPVRDFWTG